MANNGQVDESQPAVRRTSFDPQAEPASDAVLAALDAVLDDSWNPDSIDDVVDPIVFDALVRRARSALMVTFDYGDHEVTVESTGEIVIRSTDRDDPCNQVYSFEDEPPTEAVARAIADVKGVEPVELDPLYEVIDPEALNSIVDDATAPSGTACYVSFRLDDLHVRVSNDRRVFVRAATVGSEGVERRQ